MNGLILAVRFSAEVQPLHLPDKDLPYRSLKGETLPQNVLDSQEMPEMSSRKRIVPCVTAAEVGFLAVAAALGCQEWKHQHCGGSRCFSGMTMVKGGKPWGSPTGRSASQRWCLVRRAEEGARGKEGQQMSK